MLTVLLLVGLLLPQEPAEKEKAFEAILRALRAEQPEMALFLVNRPTVRTRKATRSESARNRLRHDPQWVQEMERSGVISGSCTPPTFTLGCVPPDSIGRPHQSVELSPPDRPGDDRATVTATLTLPPIRPGVANVESREYTLERAGQGAWRVVSHRVLGVT